MYPHERALVKRLTNQPFALLGVNSDADREAIKDTLFREGITWRSWWDDGSVRGPIQTEWQVAVRPTIHLLDHHGVIRYWNVAEEDIDEAIDTLLMEVENGK